MTNFPAGWDGIFEILENEPDLRTKVANFGVKFRLFQELRSSAFEGDSATSDAYYVLLKISLQYSALEALEQIVGKRSVTVNAPDLAQLFRDTRSWSAFKERLVQTADAPKLRGRIQKLMDETSTDDLRPILEAIRHGFFHPGLTAQNSTLSASADLRKYLLILCDRARQELEIAFKTWADSIRAETESGSGLDDEKQIVPQIAGGYSRQQIEGKYKVLFTENQWRIILAEVTDKEDDDTDEQVIDDAIANLAGLEAEYAWWENEMAEAQANKDTN